MSDGLVLSGLEVVNGAFGRKVPDINVERGKVCVVTGKSGSGKSTLLHTIAGFLPPGAGKILFGGRELTAIPPQKREIGFVFQEHALFPRSTVADNIAFGLRIRGYKKANRREEVNHWLKRIDMEGMGDRYPNQLSEGQAQRVAMARALAPGFSLLLLDEPFSSLDGETRVRLRELLVEIVRVNRVTALFVTHHEDDLEALKGGGVIHLG